MVNMNLDPVAVRKLYEKRITGYHAFIGFFRTRRGLQALLERSGLLQPDMRVLDAGCGSGTATLALLDALHARNLIATRVDGFDLTPAMLTRFRAERDARGLTHITLREADILDESVLPRDWVDYDLVVSTSMLEYLPRTQLPHALATLRARMAAGGRMLVMITRKSPESRVLIEWGWHAERYSVGELREAFALAGFEQLRFVRFPLRYGWLNRANHVVVAQC